MNTFRTTLPISKYPFKLSHTSQIMCVGSCFADNIGGFFTDHKFNTSINPCGISYNPISIANTLIRLTDNKPIQTNELVKNNSRHFHWDFHGEYSSESSSRLSETLNQTIGEGHRFLKESDVLFMTFGTAYVFRLLENNAVVANCHKFPNENFSRELLNQEDIESCLKTCIDRLLNFNPKLNIVLTISPVRHIRDGLVENQRSKARLITATHHMVETYDAVHYLPSYEVIMDDLRDYRFYKKDMIHINDLALDYVWNYCQDAFFETDTKQLNTSIAKLIRDCRHRPIHPETEAHQAFLSGLVSKIKALEDKHPQLDFSTELDKIRQQQLS